MSGSTKFYGLKEAAISQIVQRSGFGERVRQVYSPEHGASDEMYLVDLEGTDCFDLMVKVKLGMGPLSVPQPVSRYSPYWPEYIQQLFGRYANGDLSSLRDVAAFLETYGALKVPRLYRIDQTHQIIPAAYTVSECLTGDAFDWCGAGRFTPKAAYQLGRHMGWLHQATGTSTHTFGIFDRPDAFTGDEWWSRFGKSFRHLLEILGSQSPVIAGLRPAMLAALRQAVATGTPIAFPLICLDQTPLRYLRDTDGGIASLIDIEGYLWAPAEYELSMVEIWVMGRTDGTEGTEELAALRTGYGEILPYPMRTLQKTRPVYQLMTWMKWMYSNDLQNSPVRTRPIVPELTRLCSPFNGN